MCSVFALLSSVVLVVAAPQGPPSAAGGSSAFVAPLYLDEAPPPVRSALNIQLVYEGLPGVPRDVVRSREATLELAHHIVVLLRSGEDFVKLAGEYSAARNAGQGASLGSFQPGLLGRGMDEFLFGAELGDVSEPLETSNGFHILKRVASLAATRHILIRGLTPDSRTRVEQILRRASSGESFGDLAREASEDSFSSESGGLYTIFERGSRDRLLKEAAFQARVGEIVGPIETPVGFHLIQRVPVEGHPLVLREQTMVRLRGILLAHKDTPIGALTADRTLAESEQLARSLHARILAGEDMAAMARELNDDFGGRERAGDLGWVHRDNPRGGSFLSRAFLAAPGELLDPVLTNLGWVLLRREL